VIQELGFPALQKGGQDQKLVGYFQTDIGTINQLVHLWKFDDDADRRAHWAAVYSNTDFVEGFASKFRPPLMTQEVKLLHAAPVGSASVEAFLIAGKVQFEPQSHRLGSQLTRRWREMDSNFQFRAR
jgi:hypothetical protein